ncbi:MAG: hypothetical protein AAF399_24510 [Bacteroidota bacterium]
MHSYSRQAVELLEPLLQDIRTAYLQQMATFTDGSSLDPTGPIPVRICYAEQVPTEVRSTLEQYLKRQRFELPAKPSRRPAVEYLFRQLMDSKRLPASKGLYGLAEARHETLNLSLIEVASANVIQRKAQQTYPGFGIDPRLGVLAQFVIDEINRNRHVLHTEADKQAEYRRHIEEAIGWNQQLLATRRPFITVTASLAAMPNSPATVTIQRKVIDNLTKMRSQQVARFFDNLVDQHTQPEQLERVVIFGDTMNNDYVLDGFFRYGQDQLLLLSDDRVVDILKGMQVPDSALPPVSEAVSIPDGLMPGDKIEFEWAPNRQVKAMYNGNRSFMIVSHQHSRVITGDTFLLGEEIAVGKPALLKNVMRTTTGKVLGDYRSGALTSLRKL